MWWSASLFRVIFSINSMLSLCHLSTVCQFNSHFKKKKLFLPSFPRYVPKEKQSDSSFNMRHLVSGIYSKIKESMKKNRMEKHPSFYYHVPQKCLPQSCMRKVRQELINSPQPSNSCPPFPFCLTIFLAPPQTIFLSWGGKLVFILC